MHLTRVERRICSTIEQVDGSGFASLDIGGADTVQGGATVYAIGSPLGLQNTISQGLVSNPARVLDGVTYLVCRHTDRGAGAAAIHRLRKIHRLILRIIMVGQMTLRLYHAHVA